MVQQRRKREQKILPTGVEIDGTELRRRRWLLGDTLETFGKKCGLTGGFVSQVELGRKRVGPVAFAAICDVFGLTTHDERAILLAKPEPARRGRAAA